MTMDVILAFFVIEYPAQSPKRLFNYYDRSANRLMINALISSTISGMMP